MGSRGDSHSHSTMPGFAVGCPQRLAVRQGGSTGPHPTSILGMASDPTGAYLAILTRHDLQVGGDLSVCDEACLRRPLSLSYVWTHARHRSGAGGNTSCCWVGRPRMRWAAKRAPGRTKVRGGGGTEEPVGRSIQLVTYTKKHRHMSPRPSYTRLQTRTSSRASCGTAGAGRCAFWGWTGAWPSSRLRRWKTAPSSRGSVRLVTGFLGTAREARLLSSPKVRLIHSRGHRHQRPLCLLPPSLPHERADPPEWVDVYPASFPPPSSSSSPDGGGGGVGSSSLSGLGGPSPDDEEGAAAPLHAVEVLCVRRLELGSNKERATCLCAGPGGQRLLLGRELVRRWSRGGGRENHCG